MKPTLFTLALCFIASQIAYAQSNLDNLENAIQGVVTVAVYKTEAIASQLGARGANPAIEEAYSKALDLSGAVGSGSGFVIMKDNKSFVITNAHVIENASDASGSIYVYTINRKKYEVKVLGGDTFYDLAVLEFIDKPGPEIHHMKFRATDVRVGEKVFAIGNPLGEFPYSVSDGIISAKNRTRNSQFVGRSGFLQSTATIIWGNSGGPLVDEKGEVVGVNSQIQFASPDNVNFFIASQINFVLEGQLTKRLANEIIENDGRVQRCYLGIEFGQKVVYDEFNQASVDPVIIKGILPGSPAAKVLMDKIGFQLVAIGNENIDNIDHALEVFERIKPGQKVTLTLSNKGNSETISINSSSLKTQELEAIAQHTISKNGSLKLGQEDGNVTLTYDMGKVMEYGTENKKFKRPGKSGQVVMILLAAGMVAGESQTMYSVRDMKDVGAIIRLSSLSGVVDFYAVPQSSPSSEVKLYRHHLSGNELTQQKSLFY